MKKSVCCLLSILLFIAVWTISCAESQPSLSFKETDIVLVKGKSVKLQPVTENISIKKPSYQWESSDEAVATVANGTVKGVNPGKAIIKCSTSLEDGTVLSVEANIEVIVPVQSVKLVSRKDYVCYVGETFNFADEVIVSPDNATDRTLLWESSDPSIATIDGDGMVTGVSAGKAMIKATSKDGSKKTVQAYISVPVMKCDTSFVEVDSSEGKSFKLYYYGSDWNNVSVSAKGKCFDYSLNRNGAEVEILVSPISVGKGSITFKDKKDSKGAVNIDVSVTKEAISLSQYVQITKASVSNGSVKLSYKNNSGLDIAELEMRLIPYNQFDEQLFMTSINDEQRWYRVTKGIKNGKTVNDSLYWGYSGMTAADIAVYYLRFSDGTRVYLSDNDLYWYSTKTNSYNEKPAKEPHNSYPSKEEEEKKGSFRLGYSSAKMPKEIANHYGYHHGGEWVGEVVTDSISYKAGLKVNDVIIAVDGVYLEDDVYAVDKAKARIADGGSFTVTVERYAQEGTIDLVFAK